MHLSHLDAAETFVTLSEELYLFTAGTGHSDDDTVLTGG